MGKRPTSQTQTSPAVNTGLPESIDIERAVLGLVFLDEMAYHELVEAGLRPEYFSVESNRKIFRAMQELVAARTMPDLLMVIERLRDRGELEGIGGIPYVTALVDGVPNRTSTPGLSKYVDTLGDKYMRRQTIHMANRIAACAADPSDPIRNTVAHANEDLLRLQGNNTKEPGEFVATSTQAVLDEVSELMVIDREVIGIPYGIQVLDELTTGLRAGEITTVGAYPGGGKTAFALNVLRLAATSGKPVAFFSLEMTKRELILRLFAQVSGISYAKLRNPRNLHSQERRDLDRWKTDIDALPLLIDDHARTIEEIVPRSHLYIRKHKAELIAIDYLQLIEAPGEKEYDKVSASSDAIWWLEKSTQVPILCLSQLNRPEGRNRGSTQPPAMHQLRSSGKIEQNTHNVLLIHRSYDDEGTPTGEDLIIIAKQRAGLVGRVKARFDGPSQTWGDRDIPVTTQHQQPTIFQETRQ